MLNCLCFSVVQTNEKPVTKYSLLFARRENTNVDKLLKDGLLTEKLVADEPDAVQRNSHSIANVDDL